MCIRDRYGFQRYEQGIILTVVQHTKHREVLAVGGRYDALLRRFAFPRASSAASPVPGAAGVQIAVGKIVAALAKYQQVNVPKLMGRPEEERTLGPWTPRRCGTYVLLTQNVTSRPVRRACSTCASSCVRCCGPTA